MVGHQNDSWDWVFGLKATYMQPEIPLSPANVPTWANFMLIKWEKSIYWGDLSQNSGFPSNSQIININIWDLKKITCLYPDFASINLALDLPHSVTHGVLETVFASMGILFLTRQTWEARGSASPCPICLTVKRTAGSQLTGIQILSSLYFSSFWNH